MFTPGQDTLQRREMTKCRYHQMHIISFCLNVGCLLPLCPLCITQHEVYHFETSTEMCIVKLEQAIDAARDELSQLLLPLARLRTQYQDIRGKKLQSFYQTVQREKSLLLAKVEEEFNGVVIGYIEFIEQGLQSHKDKLQQAIRTIQGESASLLQGERIIQALVQFWMNRRALKQKVHDLQKGLTFQLGKSAPGGLDSSLLQNINRDVERVLRTTRVSTPNSTPILQTSQSPLHFAVQSSSEKQHEVHVSQRISTLQQQNRLLLIQLANNRPYN